MKKLLAMLLAMVMVFSLAACAQGGTTNGVSATEKTAAPDNNGEKDSSTSTGDSDSIDVGVCLTITGSGAPNGLIMLAGVQEYVDMVNEKGGVNGKQIKLHIQDAGNDSDACLNAMNLLEKEDLSAIIGPHGSGFIFAAQQIIEQDAHVIAAAIQNTVNVDIAALYTVKHHIIATDKVTVFAANISDRGKRRSQLCKDFQLVDCVHNAICHALRGGTVLKFRYDVVPNIIQITAGLERIMNFILHALLRGSAPSYRPASASLPFRRSDGPLQAHSSISGLPAFSHSPAYPRWRTVRARFSSERQERPQPHHAVPHCNSADQKWV